MKRLIPILLLALLLCGCSGWSSGEYHHVMPHVNDSNHSSSQNVTAADYLSLYYAINDLVDSGAETGIILVSRYDQREIERDMVTAADVVRRQNPMAAYAVSVINCELGTNSGQSAVAVKITYNRDPRQLSKIARVADMKAGTALVAAQLDACADSIVLYCERYRTVDFAQFVEDYAAENPQLVMETPQVTITIYPDSGTTQVMDVRFSYQNQLESLRQMQNYVQPLFAAAELTVRGEDTEYAKFSRLYAFLMERNDYRQGVSNTPAYSLLRHGVGDSMAFARVYAAMCARAGLECYVVSGTRCGEPWSWNIVRDGDRYYHIDLLLADSQGGFHCWYDQDMQGYIWDYSAYPACVAPY